MGGGGPITSVAGPIAQRARGPGPGAAVLYAPLIHFILRAPVPAPAWNRRFETAVRRREGLFNFRPAFTDEGSSSANWSPGPGPGFRGILFHVPKRNGLAIAHRRLFISVYL